MDASVSEQSGLAVGDVARRGRPDLVWGMYWVECPADPVHEAWSRHRYGDWNDGGWAGMAKVAIADLDGDKQTEIVATEAEIPNSRLGIFCRVPRHPE